MKVTYYVAASIDGFIAKEDGDVSWLEELGIAMEETGYDEFFSTVDALVMGRKTYEMIVSFGEWPYGDKPVWICTSGNIIPMEGSNIQAGQTPDEVYKASSELEVKHLWLVGGGSLASSFLQKKLLTNVSLSLMPIIIGNGIKLFGDIPTPVFLGKQRIESPESGMLQIEYSIK